MSVEQIFNNYGLILFVALLLSLAFHEYGHAYLAVRLGDDTPQKAGRLSFNPFKHLSLTGTLVFFITQKIGWAKPVPIDFSRLGFKKTAAVAFAGPAVNILLAFTGGLLLNLLKLSGWQSPPAPQLAFFLGSFVYVNSFLAVVNLLPIPPLDGFRIALWLGSKKYSIPEYTAPNAKKYLLLDLAGAVCFACLWIFADISSFLGKMGNFVFALAIKSGGLF